MRLHISKQWLSEREWEEIEEVLLAEMETQDWYGIAVLESLEGEICVTIQ
jgi:hypothetical protein